MLLATREDKYSNKQGAKLTAANGIRIGTFGKHTISLHFDKQGLLQSQMSLSRYLEQISSGRTRFLWMLKVSG